MLEDTANTPDEDVELDDEAGLATPDPDESGSDDDTQTDDEDGLGEDDAEQSDDDDGEDDDDGLEDVEWEGKTIRVTPEVKAALMRRADHTRKTQEVAEQRKALEAREASLAQQAELIEQLQDDRAELALVQRQLKAMDGINWDELEEEDPKEAARLTRQLTRLQTKRDELSKSVDTKTNDLALERQRSANEVRAKAIEQCQRTLAGKDGIKGWNEGLAVKLGEFAVKSLGFTPEQVLEMTNPWTIKGIHAEYERHQAQRRDRAQKKAQAGEKTAPVRGPGANPSGHARRTTDASGDRLSTDEWMRRERDRLAAARGR